MTNTKKQNKNQVVDTNKNAVDTKKTDKQQIDVQTYFLNTVKSNGYTTKSYISIGEKSVQLNGKIKLYYVPLKNGNLKLCLKNVDLSKVDTSIKGIEKIDYQNTYPNNHPQRVYFKGCDFDDVKLILDDIFNQVIPKIEVKTA